MKKFISTLLAAAALTVCMTSNAAEQKVKVIDRSAKKVPVWVNGLDQEYIITSAVAGDIETAKSVAMEEVRRQIIRSVAENISFETKSTITQSMKDSDMESFTDKFASYYRTQSANLPSVKGVSASKIEDYYWERRQNKSTKEVSVYYAIKYPLPSVELKKMVNEFEKRDRDMSERYSRLESGLNSVESLEEIDRAIHELNMLREYFFDNTRRNGAASLQAAYRGLYSGISVKELRNTLGEYRFGLMLDGRPISTSQRIAAKSDGAYDITVEPEGTTIVVRYKYDGAEYDTPTEVILSCRVGGKVLRHVFTFRVRKAAIKIYPEKTAYLTAAQKHDGRLSGIEIRIPIRSVEGESYVVRGITLDVPGLAQALFMDDLDIAVSTKEHLLKITYEDSVEVLKPLGNKASQMRGTLDIETRDGMTTSLPFALGFRPNW